jgi:hypothetical protein
MNELGLRVAAMPVLPSDTFESTINRFITYFVQEFGKEYHEMK